MNVLVTGGAGYIGSHMVRALAESGARVSVVDNLSSGHRDAVSPEVDFHAIDVRESESIRRILREKRIDAVFHFASRIQVGESVRDPKLYYEDNLGAAISLLDSVVREGTKHFILSSTAAVYGNPARDLLDEDHPTRPINPYGETKLAIEWMLASYARAYPLSFAALRYFNAAGAHPSGDLGERHDPETHLIPLVIDAALGRRSEVTLFGTDYDTADGTCVRDYIHVQDLAQAHRLALDYLVKGGTSGAFNLGTGAGHSVRDVIATVEQVSGKRVPVTIGPRREGDPAVLVASPRKAERAFGWTATSSSLAAIVRDAWAFRRQ